MSARSFSRVLGVPDNNTQNYIGAKPALPKADYLEKILLHFKSINPEWLLTGQGEAFLSGAEPATNVSVKKNKGQTIGVNHGTATYSTLADCEKELLSCQAQLAEATNKLSQAEQDRDSAKRELEVYRELVKAKDEMIWLLKGGYNRPN